MEKKKNQDNVRWKKNIKWGGVQGRNREAARKQLQKRGTTNEKPCKGNQGVKAFLKTKAPKKTPNHQRM